MLKQPDFKQKIKNCIHNELGLDITVLIRNKTLIFKLSNTLTKQEKDEQGPRLKNYLESVFNLQTLCFNDYTSTEQIDYEIVFELVDETIPNIEAALKKQGY